ARDGITLIQESIGNNANGLPRRRSEIRARRQFRREKVEAGLEISEPANGYQISDCIEKKRFARGLSDESCISPKSDDRDLDIPAAKVKLVERCGHAGSDGLKRRRESRASRFIDEYSELNRRMSRSNHNQENENQS